MYIFDKYSKLEFDRESNPPTFSRIACPKCGEGYLHHGKVTVFNREMEDSETGLKATIVKNMVTIDNLIVNTPSDRRDGIRIEIECEHCGELSVDLGIAQHKGSTFLMWVEK